MKILIHSNAPWMPSGYGKQAMYAGRLLTELGHQVSFSAFAGLGGAPLNWTIPGTDAQVAVHPSGQMPFSPDVLVDHAQAAQVDAVLALMDSYKLLPCAELLSAMPVPFVPLVVTDCVAANDGPSVPDQELIARSGALPAAVSTFGQARIYDLGPEDWEPPYVPHCVDTTVFKPADRLAQREAYGTQDKFVIGIAAANRDAVRKGFAEQFAAFAKFSERHDDAILAVFSVKDSVNGLPLAELAYDMGILKEKKVAWMPTYQQVAGHYPDQFMADWYSSLDILTNCSYGEGFGVCQLEAMACGTPVVATDCSAMTELVKGHGWLVKGQPFWNGVLRAWWTRPDVDGIVKAWESAYQARGDVTRSERCVAFAQGYSLDESRKHWASLIRDVQDWQDSHGLYPGDPHEYSDEVL